MAKTITLQDVADRCGVSHQTVSRVINGNPNVAEATRRRVADAIEALDYEPNQAARALVTRRTSMLEVITYGLAHYGPAQMVEGVERAARAQGYRLIFSSLDDASAIKRHGVSADGIIAIVPVQSALFDDLDRVFRDVPLIRIGIKPDAHVTSVVIDQSDGSQRITQHVIEANHRRIAYIGGPPLWYDAAEREAGWRAALFRNAIEPGAIERGDWTAASGYLAAQRLLARPERFSALVVANDQMALGAIAALRAAGLRVPADVSIAGFDDIPEAAFFDPPLTTVRQDFARLGTQSVDYLVALIQQPEAPRRQQVLNTELIARSSVQSVGG